MRLATPKPFRVRESPVLHRREMSQMNAPHVPDTPLSAAVPAPARAIRRALNLMALANMGCLCAGILTGFALDNILLGLDPVQHSIGALLLFGTSGTLCCLAWRTPPKSL